jgi:probable methyltransferase
MQITNLISAQSSMSLEDRFAQDVLEGFSREPKSLSAQYFYDDRGSELFQQISQEPEYYLTSKELSILSEAADELPKMIHGDEIDIIELGVGDGHKSQLIIESFLAAGKRVRYFPLDISEKAFDLLKDNQEVRPNLTVHGIVADYFTGLSYLRERSNNPQLVLFLGSSIGNFEPTQAQDFLNNLWKFMNPDSYVLIGFDQKKDIRILNRAYNDAHGTTREFNLNLLLRMNRELAANFHIDKFQHYGYYNPVKGAMESYIISLEDQDVFIGKLGHHFHFAKYEPIYVENSFKYLPEDIKSLANESGFKPIKDFSDRERYFIDALWRAGKR